MKNFLTIAVAFLLSALLSTGLASAQQEPSPEGRWEGRIETPGRPLEVIVDLVHGGGGEWRGEIDIPVQRAKDFRLANVKVDGLQVSFSMQGVPGNPSFRGKLSKNGENISGDFSQGSAHLPFTLKRSGGSPDVPAEPASTLIPDGVPGEGLEGIWLGVLHPGSLNLQLLFKISKAGDGTLTGTVDSIDQGAEGLKISGIRVDGDSVRLKLKEPIADFEGTISEDGSQITGEWRQGSSALPLVIQRQQKIPDLGRPQDPKKPYPYDEVEVSFMNDRAVVKFAGTLTLPRSKQRVPAVLLVSGSGPQDRNETLMGHRPFLVLADHLTRRGIAVLRVDDRGVGGSTGSVFESTMEDFASDALAAVEFLKDRDEIDPARIGILGHSEGAIVAPLAAAMSQDVAFIVLLAAPGLVGEELLYLQSAAMMRAMGTGKDPIRGNRAMQARLFAVVKAEKNNDTAMKKFLEIQQGHFSGLTDHEKQARGYPGEEVLKTQSEMLLTPWFRHFLTFDPAPRLRQVKCPVLVVAGERDLQVPPTENMPPIEEALKAAGNKDYKLVELPGLNHLLQTSRTGLPAEYSKIAETIASVALETIGAWIAEHTQTGG